MKNKAVAVLDFGSSKISIIVGNRYPNDNFRVFATSESGYAGFVKGEFLDKEQLQDKLEECIRNAEKQWGQHIEKLYVGVPSEFCYNETKTYEKDYKKTTKIRQKDIDYILNDDDDSVNVLHKNPICFSIDNENIISNPIGLFAKSIKCQASIVYVQSDFRTCILGILKKLKIRSVELVCSMLAEASYLFDAKERENGVVLIDCGYITSSVCICMGDGLLDLRSFSMGGGHITGDIYDVMKLSFMDSESIKRNLVIGLTGTGLEFYETKTEPKSKVMVKMTNEVALARIDLIIDLIKASLKDMNYNTDNMKMYLTGGGLSYMHGIEAYMSANLGQEIQVIVPHAINLAKPDLSSIVGLLSYAHAMENV